MINSSLLRKKIDDSGFKIRFVAKRAGMSYQSLLNKLNNRSEFRVAEIKKLCDLLNLTDDERNNIFFATCVDK